MQRKIVFREEYLEKYTKSKAKLPMIHTPSSDGKQFNLLDTIEQTLEVASIILDENSKISKAINLGKELFKIFKL